MEISANSLEHLKNNYSREAAREKIEKILANL